jgi:hypothetical protein
MLFFPDRQPRLCFVDDLATRVERRAAVLRRNADPHRNFAKLQVADAVHCARRRQRESLFCFGQDFHSLGFGKGCVCLIFERLHRLPIVSISDSPLEGHDRAGTLIGKRTL